MSILLEELPTSIANPDYLDFDIDEILATVPPDTTDSPLTTFFTDAP